LTAFVHDVHGAGLDAIGKVGVEFGFAPLRQVVRLDARRLGRRTLRRLALALFARAFNMPA